MTAENTYLVTHLSRCAFIRKRIGSVIVQLLIYIIQGDPNVRHSLYEKLSDNVSHVKWITLYICNILGQWGNIIL